jgi:hypothetical protein
LTAAAVGDPAAPRNPKIPIPCFLHHHRTKSQRNLRRMGWKASVIRSEFLSDICAIRVVIIGVLGS